MEWKYYNHAMIPDYPPHENVDTSRITDKSIWKLQGKTPILARWTSDFDCGYETNWWYVIKDEPFDISQLKAKRRYEITKARRNFSVRRINSADYAEELFRVQVSAFSGYPERLRPKSNHDSFITACKNNSDTWFAAFLKDENGCETSRICGFSYLQAYGKCIRFKVQKTDPEYEKMGTNAALVDGILSYYEKELAQGSYVYDGERSICHDTAFQDYLEKYFDFKKAYCKFHIVYRPSVRWVIPFLYAVRNLLKKLDSIDFIHLVNSVLDMEEIKRKC